MTAVVVSLTLTLLVTGAAFVACWHLLVVGVAAGDHPGDAVTSVHRDGDGRVRVLVDAGPGAAIVVGIRTVARSRLMHSALVGPLVVRTRRRPRWVEQLLVGVVEPLGTGQWWVEAGPGDRVVVTLGQPGGRLHERDHAAPAMHPPQGLAA